MPGYYAIVFLLSPPHMYYAVNPSLRRKLSVKHRKIEFTQGRLTTRSKFTMRSNFATRSVFSTAGCFGCGCEIERIAVAATAYNCGCDFQKRKRHININFFVRLVPVFTGFVLGTNPACPWDKSGEKQGQTQEFSYSTQWKPDFTGFVPGTNPVCPRDNPGDEGRHRKFM